MAFAWFSFKGKVAHGKPAGDLFVDADFKTKGLFFRIVFVEFGFLLDVGGLLAIGSARVLGEVDRNTFAPVLG